MDKEIYTPRTQEEIKKIENLILKHCGTQMRDVWRLGVQLGLRIDELLQIKFEHIVNNNLSRLTVIKTRNNESLTTNLSPVAVEVVSNIRKEYPTDTYVFQSRNSRNRANKEPKPISRRAVVKAFSNIGELLNVRLTANSMRQIFVTKLFMNSRNN